MKLEILEIPHPLLRQKSMPVDAEEKEIKKLLADMLETMYAAHGVGLAAPQVGVLKRIVVIDVSREDEKPNPLFLINPKIVAHSEEKAECSEGCLSVPNQFAPVERFVEVTVEYEDADRQPCRIIGDGLLAIALQHEIDHLDGIIFVDYLSKLRQKMIMKRLEKNRKRKALEEAE